MADVRALQALLDGGVTDPATILAAMPDGPVQVPDDGREHDCRCGDGPYTAPEGRVTGFEGEPVLFCAGCGAELEVGP